MCQILVAFHLRKTRVLVYCIIDIICNFWEYFVNNTLSSYTGPYLASCVARQRTLRIDNCVKSSVQ